MSEEGGVRKVPIKMVNGEMGKGGAMETQDIRYLFGHYLNAYPSVLEISHTDHSRLSFPLRLLALLGREAMGNTDMPPLCIQASHLRSEKATMRGGVLLLSNSNRIMNHLVENDVLHYVLR